MINPILEATELFSQYLSSLYSQWQRLGFFEDTMKKSN